MGFGCKRQCARIVVQDFRVVPLDLSGTGSGRCDHVIEFAESRDDLFCDLSRVLVGAGVPGRLSAAGLHLWHDHIAPGTFEQLRSGKSDPRPHEIDKTGDEKPDAGLCTHGAGFLGARRGRLTRDFGARGMFSPSALVWFFCWFLLVCWLLLAMSRSCEISL